jgi:hypothetical protein
MFLSWLRQRVPSKRPAGGTARRSPAKPNLEQLEDRSLMTVNLGLTTCLNSVITNNPLDTPGIANSYAGVGFQNNVVGYLDAQINGQRYTGLNNVANVVQINWGGINAAGASSSAGVLADMGPDPTNSSYEEYAIKGSFAYLQTSPSGGYDVQVFAQAPGSPSVSGLVATANVYPMPSNLTGTQPQPIANPTAAGNVSVQLSTCLNSVPTGNPGDTPGIANSYAGVGFQDNIVGYLDVSVNGQRYPGLNNLPNAVQINWGDSTSWDTASLVDMGIDPTNSSYEEYEIKGSHVDQQPSPSGGYDVVVYAQGPDSTSLSALVATANVYLMPSNLDGTQPQPITNPTAAKDVSLGLSTCLDSVPTGNPLDTPGIANSYAGIGFQDNIVGYVDVSVNGQRYPGLQNLPNAVQINWGDSTSWDTGTLVDLGQEPLNRNYEKYEIEGSHVYQQPSPAGGYDLVVFAQGPDSTSLTALTATANVLPNPNPPQAPVITLNPTSEAVTAGQTATFTAAASGNPAPTVQWQVSTNGGSTWSNLNGATSTTLTLNNVQAFQSGSEYRAVFSNSAGSTPSTAATLTVNAAPSAPVVTLNPTSQTVMAGQTATFTASASGNPAPAVQWQVSTNGGSTFSNISGATGTTLTVNNATTGMNGTKYRAVFSNSAGTAPSTAATLTVTLALSPTGGSLPAGTVGTFYDQTIAAGGGNSILSVSTTLQSGTLPAGLHSSISGGTLTISGTPTAAGSVSFQVTATDSAGDLPLTQLYTLTIAPVPPLPPPWQPPKPPPVPVAAFLVPVHFGKHTQLVAEVVFSDGSVMSEIAVPFQQPKYSGVQAMLANVNPADGSFELMFTAHNGKKTVTGILPL